MVAVRNASVMGLQARCTNGKLHFLYYKKSKTKNIIYIWGLLKPLLMTETVVYTSSFHVRLYCEQEYIP